MQSKKFQRKIEDFVCGHCGARVSGDGYTNHCPHCLWSNHADRNPGDRAAQCGGMMRPIRVEKHGAEYAIIHKCEACGYERPNKTAPEDSVEALSKI